VQLFSNIQDELISRINQSTDSLRIAVTWFTNHDIFDAILKKLDNPEYQVDLIVLNDRINNKREGVDFQKLVNLKGNFYYSDSENMVHHKFCIIDSQTVITGSYNWTYYAENRNWENIVVLKDNEITLGFIQEFEKIKQRHVKVENVISKQKLDIGINSNEYLETDYSFQAKREEEKGNDFAVAKIYTEILKLNNKHSEIQKARTTIVDKINSLKFTTCPFEIGIHYKNGYSMAIPAFSVLPITVVKGGSTPVSDATSLQITIQKYDYIHTNILQFTLNNLKPCPIDTQKIEHTMTVNENGILRIVCRELNGFDRTKTLEVDLKKWL
jgi:PLD-like domain